MFYDRLPEVCAEDCEELAWYLRKLPWKKKGMMILEILACLFARRFPRWWIPEREAGEVSKGYIT